MILDRDRNPPLVMLGLFYGSLQVARSLGGRGIDVYGIDRERSPIGSRSRYVRCLDAPGEEGLLAEYLVEFSGRNGPAPVLIPLSDSYVQFVARHDHGLKDHYRYTIPRIGEGRNLVSKVDAYEVFSRLGIEAPVTMRVTEDTIESAPDEIRFPCILKPEFHDTWLNDREVMNYIGLGNKVIFVNDFQELKAHFAKLHAFGELVLQEYIPGDSRALYYYVGYRNRAGAMLVSHVANKVRTFPDRLGSETMLRSVRTNDLLELGSGILHKLDYTGPAGIDFKYDSRDGTFKVIEMNCRLGLNDCFLAKHGIDIPYAYYLDSMGCTVRPMLDYPEGITWYSFRSDLGWMRLYGKSNGLTWPRWFVQLLKGHDSYEVFSWSDPVPFVVSLHELASRFLRKAAGAGRVRDRSMERSIAR